MRFGAYTLALLLALPQPALAFKEIEVQERYCVGLPINQYLNDGTEVDCIRGDLAIEVDFTEHWAQSIGQSLHYAQLLARRPAVILVCNENLRVDTCRRHVKRFVDTINHWRIGMLLWFCDAKHDASLNDCEYTDFYEDGDFR